MPSPINYSGLLSKFLKPKGSSIKMNFFNIRLDFGFKFWVEIQNLKSIPNLPFFFFLSHGGQRRWQSNWCLSLVVGQPAIRIFIQWPGIITQPTVNDQVKIAIGKEMITLFFVKTFEIAGLLLWLLSCRFITASKIIDVSP